MSFAPHSFAIESGEKTSCILVTGISNLESNANKSLNFLNQKIQKTSLADRLVRCELVHYPSSFVHDITIVKKVITHTGGLDKLIKKLNEEISSLDDGPKDYLAGPLRALRESLIKLNSLLVKKAKAKKGAIVFCHSAGCLLAQEAITSLLLDQRLWFGLVKIGPAECNVDSDLTRTILLQGDKIIEKFNKMIGVQCSEKIINDDETKNCHKLVDCYLSGNNSWDNIVVATREILDVLERRTRKYKRHVSNNPSIANPPTETTRPDCPKGSKYVEHGLKSIQNNGRGSGYVAWTKPDKDGFVGYGKRPSKKTCLGRYPFQKPPTLQYWNGDCKRIRRSAISSHVTLIYYGHGESFKLACKEAGLKFVP